MCVFLFVFSIYDQNKILNTNNYNNYSGEDTSDDQYIYHIRSYNSLLNPRKCKYHNDQPIPQE